MVIIKYRKKNTKEYIRESFLDPQHYMKWRELNIAKVEDIRPVRSVGVSCVK